MAVQTEAVDGRLTEMPMLWSEQWRDLGLQEPRAAAINRLSLVRRTQIIGALVEGNSIRMRRPVAPMMSLST